MQNHAVIPVTFMVYWSCRLKDGVKVLSALQVVMLPLTYASEKLNILLPLTRERKGGMLHDV